MIWHNQQRKLDQQPSDDEQQADSPQQGVKRTWSAANALLELHAGLTEATRSNMADVEMTDANAAPKAKSSKVAAGGDVDGKKRFEVKKVCISSQDTIDTRTNM